MAEPETTQPPVQNPPAPRLGELLRRLKAQEAGDVTVDFTGEELTLLTDALEQMLEHHARLAAPEDPRQYSEYDIPAVCYPDDQRVTANFDAKPWFAQASDGELYRLAECGWGGDDPADEVARFMVTRDSEVSAMFSYQEGENLARHVHGHDTMGFECHIMEPETTLTWLSKHHRNFRFVSEDGSLTLYWLGGHNYWTNLPLADDRALNKLMLEPDSNETWLPVSEDCVLEGKFVSDFNPEEADG